MKILIIEDDKEVGFILRTELASQGIEALVIDNGNSLHSVLQGYSADVILLDYDLPGKKGIDILKEIRSQSAICDTPVIMVTGMMGNEERVEAFENGADDCVAKPFHMKELMARIRAVFRRVKGSNKPTKIVAKALEIDFKAHRVVLDGADVPLTLTEFKILSELLRQGGNVLSRDELRMKALGNLNVTDRTIDVHMASIRKKLSGVQESIQTVRGVGYRFVS